MLPIGKTNRVREREREERDRERERKKSTTNKQLNTDSINPMTVRQKLLINSSQDGHFNLQIPCSVWPGLCGAKC